MTFTQDGEPPEGTFSAVQPPWKTSPREALAIPPVLQAPLPAISSNQSNSTAQLPIPNFEGANLSPVCTTNGLNTIVVHFIRTEGDLPRMRADNSLLIDAVNDNGLLATGKIKIFTDGENVNGYTSIRGIFFLCLHFCFSM